MLTYDAVETPLGELLVFVGPAGVVRIAFPEEDPDHDGVRTADAERGDLGAIREQLDDYFAGRRKTFDLPVDLRLDSDFDRAVLDATATIPYGSTTTYGTVAAKAGAPRGGRAAGNALNKNPVPLVIPCHRVILASGELGGYAGHEDRKAWLLRHEGAL
jgi:methylated-DNA-[protein]-cysteine S-methyltransferase